MVRILYSLELFKRMQDQNNQKTNPMPAKPETLKSLIKFILYSDIVVTIDFRLSNFYIDH